MDSKAGRYGGHRGGRRWRRGRSCAMRSGVACLFRYEETCTTDASGTGSRSFFEMQAFLHPNLANMRYVDKLASSPAHADVVKKKIRAGIHGLLTEVVAANHAAATAAAAAAAEAAKAAETAAGEEDASVDQKHKATIGYFSGGGAGIVRTVLAAPASWGSLEPDFCMAGRLIRPDRTSLRPRFVEMRIFLNANIDAMPALDWTPALSAEAAEMAVPVRLQDPAVLKATAALFRIQPAAGVEAGVDDRGTSEMRTRGVPMMMRRRKMRMKRRRPTVFSQVA
ncbi:unnamed protein product [Phaeothamnion confervicola]